MLFLTQDNLCGKILQYGEVLIRKEAPAGHIYVEPLAESLLIMQLYRLF
jgi:hypothetical protein